ncbi:hypothetical protein [Marinicella marina]|uniref:hypothetical protein n=1 Tax=Marinicella marina TaxID=2996016 RepID=UPI0024BCC5A0|nr:hypothetical protein [Marinicella marina]MDJ1139612.1 hypothetical protein [Marinicella marina]
MSAHRNLLVVFNRAIQNKRLTKNMAVDLYLEIMDALDWEIPTVEYSSDNDYTICSDERRAANEFLSTQR